MPFEVTNVPRDLRHWEKHELIKWFSDDAGWEPSEGQRVAVELNRLEEMVDLDWINPKVNSGILRSVERFIKRDKIFIGRTFVVREIVGTRTDRPI